MLMMGQPQISDTCSKCIVVVFVVVVVVNDVMMAHPQDF